ncbi:hypothetical protein Tco_1166037 [Tanacetum coccineum]
MWGSSPNNAFSKPDPHAHDKTSPPGPFDGDKVIPKNQVVVVVGESDTRNTTQPPQYLHKDGYTKNGMVGCTQSRRLAATSLDITLIYGDGDLLREKLKDGNLIKKTSIGKQPELENHVGVGGYGYPAFIPLNIKNGAYALLKRFLKGEQINILLQMDQSNAP